MEKKNQTSEMKRAAEQRVFDFALRTLGECVHGTVAGYANPFGAYAESFLAAAAACGASVVVSVQYSGGGMMTGAAQNSSKRRW